MDLIAAAQGAHWFDLPKFYAGIGRVARSGAVVAIWGYSYCELSPEIDAAVAETLLAPIAPYWGEGNRVIMERYRSIPFPFKEVEPPTFVMRHDWSRDLFFGYLRTWSAYKRYRLEHADDPLEPLGAALAAHWRADEVRPVRFEIVMRIGRVS